MAHTVALTPEELKHQAKVYNEAIELLQQARDKVKTANGQMALQWRGKAYERYLVQSEQLDGGVVAFQNLLSTIYTQVTTYAETVAQRDIEDQSRFGLQ